MAPSCHPERDQARPHRLQSSGGLADLSRRLTQAIESEHVVAFRYNDRQRLAEPHILGFDHEGELLLSAWQLSGGSGVAFRTYRLERMSELCETDARFPGPRPIYNPRHAIFARVLSRL